MGDKKKQKFNNITIDLSGGSGSNGQTGGDGADATIK